MPLTASPLASLELGSMGSVGDPSSEHCADKMSMIGRSLRHYVASGRLIDY